MNDALEALTGLRLADPWWLLAVLVVPVAVWWRFRRGHAALGFAPAGFLRTAGLMDSPDGRGLRTLRVLLRPIPPTLQALALVALAVALARPVARTPLPLRAAGIDILLCVDVSSSMTADDLASDASRLDVARRAAERFVRARPNDRIGLLTFARYPDVRCPPTLDHAALRTLLDEVRTVAGDSPEDATGIGAAVARAAQVLGGGSSTSKVVVLLTDGEENVATAATPREIAPLHAAQLCVDLGVRVYTIVAGAAGGIDTRPVEDLATRTGGAFFAARDAAALGRVYATVDELERMPIDAPRYDQEERFAAVLGLAVVLFVLARLADTTILGTLP